MPRCDSENFQVFLNEFSVLNHNEFKIVVLDNGAFHKAMRLIVPKNIALVFLPPYSPELNPAEKIWQRIKRNFTNRLHSSLCQLSSFIEDEVKLLNKDIVKSTCSFQYVFLDHFWTNI
jgi:transposase